MSKAAAAAAAVTADRTATTTRCPKCATTMVLVAIRRHPIAARMERHMLVCAKCNQTKIYMLPAKISDLVLSLKAQPARKTASL